MARISTYGQDSTLSKADKVLGTDSATGGTKNYTIESILSVANEDNLVEVFDGAAFEFKNYVDPSQTVNGVLNLNAGSAVNTAFSAINVLYISVNDKSGNSLREYLENADNDFIKISKTDNLNQFGIYEVTNIEDYGSNKYKKLTLTARGTNGTLTVGTKYFVANYSALYDQDFSDDSVTEFQDVSNAGSGKIITSDERAQLQSLNANALVHNDVVDNVTSTATDVPLSANQGRVLKGLIDSIDALLDVQDNTALDSLQEIVDYIETNRETLDALSISSIPGLQAALDGKQNTESGKGLSAENFTSALKTKLENIAANAQVNVNADWTAASGDAQILNKPADLTNLGLHYVTSLIDVNTAGSGDIITSDERTKLNNIESGAQVNVKADWNESDSTSDAFIQNKPTFPPSDAEANVQVNWDEDDTQSDAFIQNKPDVTLKADKATTITVQGTTNEVEVSPNTAQDLSENRTVTIGLPDDVTIGDDLTVTNKVNLGGPMEFTGVESTAPTFDNGLYYSTDDAHDTLHFRYHGHDLSIDYLTQNIPTGILSGGELAKVDATTFSITAGDGVINILNKGVADPHPEIKKIEWSAQNITHTEGDSGNADQINTWIYINSSGSVVQTTTFPGPGVWRDNIVIGSVIHSSNVIRFTKTFPRPSYSTGNTYAEFAEIFGPLKKSGHLLTANTTHTLRLDRSAGVSFALGRNYTTDAENPSIVDDAASTPVFHRYSSTSTGFTKDDGDNGTGYTDLDPTKYDNNGTLTSMQNSKFSVQRLYHFPNNTNVIVAYYGKDHYQSIEDAEKNYLLEDFQEADNTASQAIYLGAIVVKGNATDLTDSAQAKILTGGIFRSLAATNLGGVAADSALNDLTDVSISSPSNDQVLKYNSSSEQWENQADEGGIELTDISVGADAAASGDGGIAYDNTTGVFTYTPPASISGTGSATPYPRLAIWSDTDSLTNDANLTWNSTNGRLGVGTSTANTAYHAYHATDDVIGTLQSGDARAQLEFRDINTLPQSSPRIGGVGNDTIFSRGSTESMRIKSDGKVGIGTDAPAASLDIDATDAIIIPKGTDAQRDALTAESGMFRFNTTDNEFEGYDGTEWGAIGGSGGGGSANIVKKTFNGGVAAYVLDNTIADIDNVQVFVDGVYQYPSNYTVSGSTVTFVSGSEPASGTNNVHISHFVSATITEGSVFSTMEDVGDGSQTSFALGNTPRDVDHTFVYLNGVYQEKSTYSISGSNIVFSPAVPDGVSIEVRFVTGVVDLTDIGDIVLKEYTGDGSTSTYALGTSPLSEAYVDAYLNGVYQEAGTFSLSGSNIVFDTNVPNGVSIEIKSRSSVESSAISATNIETDTFTGDGSTASYTLVNGSPTSKSLTMVYVQGVYQAKANYSLTSGAIVFQTAPAEDDAIEVLSISAINTSSPVTSVNGETGAVTVQSKHSVSVISADTNAVANTVYVFTASLTLTLPASPSVGDSIKISNLSDVATCVLGRNGNKIMGDAEDLTLDTASASFELIYSGSTKGWVIIGQ